MTIDTPNLIRAAILLDGAISQTRGTVAFLWAGNVQDALGCHRRAGEMWRDANIELRAIKNGAETADEMARAAVEFREQRGTARG